MRKSRSSISKAASYKEIGVFWDTHDLSDYWDKTTEAEFDMDVINGLIIVYKQVNICVVLKSMKTANM